MAKSQEDEMGRNENTCDCNVVHEESIEHVREEIASAEELAKMTKLYKVFGDSTRLNILAALNCHEMCVCDLAVLMNMTKSATSHQLRILRYMPQILYRNFKIPAYHSIQLIIQLLSLLGTPHFISDNLYGSHFPVKPYMSVKSLQKGI